MIRVPKSSFAIIAAIAVAGCASGPRAAAPVQTTTMRVGGVQPIEIRTDAGLAQTNFYAPIADVFQALEAAYRTLEIPIMHRNPSKYEVGNQNHEARRIDGLRMSRYVDCGTSINGPLANTYEITLSIMSVLATTDDEGVSVTTVLGARGEPRATSGNPIPCNSLGVLEERVAQLVAEELIGQ